MQGPAVARLRVLPADERNRKRAFCRCGADLFAIPIVGGYAHQLPNIAITAVGRDPKQNID